MKATFLYKDKSLCGYVLEGHCGGVAGSDIVCAAVSSAAYLTANTITEVIRVRATVSVDESGKMELMLSPADCTRCADVLQGFRLHIESLANDYPQKIQLTNAEV